MCTNNCFICIHFKIYILFIYKTCGKIVWISLLVNFLPCMMVKNCKYIGFVAWHMAMDKKCCLITFQYGVDLMWQFCIIFFMFRILCLQIGGNWARSPTRVQALFQMEISFQDALIVLIVIQLHTTCH